MTRYKSAFEHTLFNGNIYKVNNGKFGNLKLDSFMLKKLLTQVEAMLSHHNKLTIAQFELHPVTYSPDNALLSCFFDKAKRHAVRHYKVVRLGYAWIREVEKAKGQHYHCFIVLDGNKVKSPHKLIEYMRKRWLFITDGSFHIPDNHLHHIERDSSEGVAEMVYRLSYYAKARCKGYRAKAANDFSTSRIKIKQGNKL